ncbi:hypothetical protein ACHAW6_007577 [Cyclotella cf. meneghiniana]
MRITSLTIPLIAHHTKYGSASFLHASNPPLFSVTNGGYSRGQLDSDRKDKTGTTITEAARPDVEESVNTYIEQTAKSSVPILLGELNGHERNADRQVNAGIRKLQSANWTQLGADIDGEAAYDYSGSSVSLSSDGKVLAIGAIYNDGRGSKAGHVRVYSYTGTDWTQLGSDIDGEAADDYSGSSISLSSDGKVLAVGANGNDGRGSDAGHIRVYSFTGTAWTQLGADIDGEAAGDGSGRSVSLSSDGKVLAVGANGNDGSGTDAGHVRVYNFTGTGWTQLGADIDGEAAHDQSGYSVSLSNDGKVLAVGAIYNDGSGTDAGHVRVYSFAGTGWTQLGADIDGEAAHDWSGSSISLSSDGNVLAVGAYGNDGSGGYAGHVRVYQNDFLSTTNSPSSSPIKSTTAPPSFIPSKPPSNSPSSSPSLSPSSMLQNVRDKSINSTCTVKSDTFWLNCSASTNVLVAGIFKTSLIQGNCTAGSPPTQESPHSSIAFDVNVDCKNSGTCTRTHCFRADFVVEGVSVLASMFEVVSTITFEKDGTFSVEVDTSDFTASSEQTNTTVAATVTATLGDCGSTPNSGEALEIGDTAVICISSPDNVKLSLKSVTAKPGDQVLVNDNGEPNFLTTFNGNAQSVTLRTLMIPAYFDSQGGSAGSITIEGTAEISYSARHLVSSRYLGEVEEALFGLEVPLIHHFDDQKVVQVNAEGNFGNIVGLGSMIPLVGAGAVFVMFLIQYA